MDLRFVKLAILCPASPLALAIVLLTIIAPPSHAIAAAAAPAPSSSPLMLLPVVGQSSAYHFAFDGQFWDGATLSEESDETLKSDLNGVELTNVDSKTKKKSVLKGTLDAHGLLVAADTAGDARSFGAHNTVTSLVKDAPAMTPGAHWAATIAVQSGPKSSDLVDVPVEVKVTSADGGAILLQGTGTRTATSKYGPFTSPIDLTVRLAARFWSGRLQRADYAAKEFVHAGPFSQTMHWTWSLALQ